MCVGQVLSQLRVVARSEASAERFDREVWSAGLSPTLSLWKKLNQVCCGLCCDCLSLQINLMATLFNGTML